MSTFFDSPIEIEKPWGKFVQFTKNESSTVKILTVKKNEAFSLQYHKEREEFWLIISGSGTVQIGEEVFEIKQSSRFFIPKGVNHRINAGEEDVVVLEISTGNFDEEDIVRLEDRYGRVNK